MIKLVKEKCFYVVAVAMFFTIVCFGFGFMIVIALSNNTASTSTNNKNNIKKYELISVKIYTQEKNAGNAFNQRTHTEEHIKYSFVDKKGDIISKDINFEDSQKRRYRLHKSKDNKPYLVDKSDYGNASLDFYLNEDIYKNIYR